MATDIDLNTVVCMTKRENINELCSTSCEWM